MLTSSCEMMSVMMIMNICQRCRPSRGSARNVRSVSFCGARRWSVSPAPLPHHAIARTLATMARVTPMAVRCTCERVIWCRSAGDARSSVTRCSQARFQYFVVLRAAFITSSFFSAAASFGHSAACASIHSRPASTIVLQRATSERATQMEQAFAKQRTVRREDTSRRRPTPKIR